MAKHGPLAEVHCKTCADGASARRNDRRTAANPQSTEFVQPCGDAH